MECCHLEVKGKSYETAFAGERTLNPACANAVPWEICLLTVHKLKHIVENFLNKNKERSLISAFKFVCIFNITSLCDPLKCSCEN